MFKHDNVYAQAEEKFLKAVKLYATADDGALYIDAEYTETLDKDELENFFIKGLIVVFNDAYYHPVCGAVADGEFVVTVAADGANYNFKSTTPVE